MLIVLTKSHDKMFCLWGVGDNIPPQEAKREAEYNMNDLNIARQEIDVLENELADVRAAVGGDSIPLRFHSTGHWLSVFQFHFLFA